MQQPLVQLRNQSLTEQEVEQQRLLTNLQEEGKLVVQPAIRKESLDVQLFALWVT